MFKLFAFFTFAIVCVSAKPQFAAIAAPAVVTATSSQVVARNYNGIAAPIIAAPAAYTAAYTAPVAAAAYTAPLAAAYSAPYTAAAYTSPFAAAYTSPFSAAYTAGGVVTSPYAAAYNAYSAPLTYAF